ncbi:MAG TPA: hypothetical protein VKF82_05565 [Candidatus Eremiobacteraceae bacterium]|nr:hypothetical protein [Candidatus Eremiobacteraceae bacterium]
MFRPVGEVELELVRQAAFRIFPPRLPGQPIFYPVLSEEYASQIARDWNAKDGKKGHVLRFEVEADYISKYQVHQVGSRIHQEYWIPAAELDEFNRHIVGLIELIATY